MTFTLEGGAEVVVLYERLCRVVIDGGELGRVYVNGSPVSGLEELLVRGLLVKASTTLLFKPPPGSIKGEVLVSGAPVEAVLIPRARGPEDYGPRGRCLIGPGRTRRPTSAR